MLGNNNLGALNGPIEVALQDRVLFCLRVLALVIGGSVSQLFAVHCPVVPAAVSPVSELPLVHSLLVVPDDVLLEDAPGNIDEGLPAQVPVVGKGHSALEGKVVRVPCFQLLIFDRSVFVMVRGLGIVLYGFH